MKSGKEVSISCRDALRGFVTKKELQERHYHSEHRRARVPGDVLRNTGAVVVTYRTAVRLSGNCCGESRNSGCRFEIGQPR